MFGSAMKVSEKIKTESRDKIRGVGSFNPAMLEK